MLNWRAASVLLIAMACVPAATSGPSGHSGPPGPPGGAPPGGYAASACDAACAHLLGCFGQDNPNSRANCNTDCAGRNATTAELDAIQAATCDQLADAMQGNQNGSFDFGAAGGATEPTGGGGCAADCTGCVGDGTSCYHGTGLACDDCCCAPGGPSPTWE